VTPPLALRTRVLIGAVLWSLGLFLVTGIVTTQIMFHKPEAPRIVHGFFTHVGALSVVAAACMIVGLYAVRRGLSTLDRLRGRLTAVREGSDQRLSGHYPSEVQPLVDELNALLIDRDERVARALAKAGDLAHGLKTPLAVLAQEAEQAERNGDGDTAAAIVREVARMRRQVEFHLAHTSAAASGATLGVRSRLSDSVEALERALLRLHAGRGVRFATDVPADLTVRSRREALDEMLGNLLDNACKWARSMVTVRAARDGAETVIVTVDDDGPGIDEGLRDVVLQRGVRADEAAPGSGLGLAIVRDLAELHRGSITLERSPDGGTRARLKLPG
jgi:signal transduction histidine kinase